MGDITIVNRSELSLLLLYKCTNVKGLPSYNVMCVGGLLHNSNNDHHQLHSESACKAQLAKISTLSCEPLTC